MDAKDMYLIQEDYKLEFIFRVEEIALVDILPLSDSNRLDYAKFVNKNPDDIDENEFESIWFSYQTPSQTDLFLYISQQRLPSQIS
jgi:phosphoribosylaminoimidazole-succinocarboxamide synthase